MTSDSAAALLQTIRDHRLPGLEPVEGFVYPNYDGLSILNVPSTACRLFDIPPLAPPPLRPEIVNHLGGDIQNVIVILMDALAYHRLQTWLADDSDLIWNRIAANDRLTPITSISPSTTSAAITAMWTAAPAVQHGVMGYEMWLKEYGVIANMIEHKPATFNRQGSSLEAAGFSPDSFLPVNSIAYHFAQHGVTPHVFQHSAILNSGLSRTYLGDAHLHGVNTPADMWIQMKDMLEARKTERKYVWAYWGALDHASHLYGPDHPIPRGEFLLFSRAFEEFFLNALSPEIRDRTVVILTADHGQVTTDKTDAHGDLANHPDFMDMLHMTPTGENRLAYLHIRPGQVDAVREYISAAWPDQFRIIDPQTALDAGLFGTGDPHPHIRDRIGDLIVVARDHARWWWANREDPLIGRHGGLYWEEMIVPFLSIRM